MTILVPVDFSDATAGVIQQAKRLAEGLDAEVMLLHVVSPTLETVGYTAAPAYGIASIEPLHYVPPPMTANPAGELQETREKLRALGAGMALSRERVKTDVVIGVPGDQIRLYAGKQHADMIIIGSHGHGAVYQLLVGSTTDDVLRHATCPVLVVPVKKKE